MLRLEFSNNVVSNLAKSRRKFKIHTHHCINVYHVTFVGQFCACEHVPAEGFLVRFLRLRLPALDDDLDERVRRLLLLMVTVADPRRVLLEG